ncbi:MAG: hypothetical protein AAGA70_11655 [Pseudomonadota bacterium]
MCGKKGCEQYGKSTKRDALEGEVGEWVKSLQPTKGLMKLAAAMFRIAWDARSELAAEMRQAAVGQIKTMDKEIDTVLGRIAAATNARVIACNKDKIADLEKQEALLVEKQAY